MIVGILPHTGGMALVRHVLSAQDNDAVTIAVSPALAATTCVAAMEEMQRLAQGCRSGQPFIHVHASPSTRYTVEQWTTLWDEFEAEFGLIGMPWFETEHMKIGAGGRIAPHRHRVYLRIRPDRTAVSLSHSHARGEKIARLAEARVGERITIGAHHFAVLNAVVKEGRHDIAEILRAAKPAENASFRRAAPSSSERAIAERLVDFSADEIWRRCYESYLAAEDGRDLRSALRERDLLLAKGDKAVVVVGPGGSATPLLRAIKKGSGNGAGKKLICRKRKLDALIGTERLPSLETVRAELVKATGRHPTFLTPPGLDRGTAHPLEFAARGDRNAIATAVAPPLGATDAIARRLPPSYREDTIGRDKPRKARSPLSTTLLPNRDHLPAIAAPNSDDGHFADENYALTVPRPEAQVREVSLAGSYRLTDEMESQPSADMAPILPRERLAPRADPQPDPASHDLHGEGGIAPLPVESSQGWRLDLLSLAQRQKIAAFVAAVSGDAFIEAKAEVARECLAADLRNATEAEEMRQGEDVGLRSRYETVVQMGERAARTRLRRRLARAHEDRCREEERVVSARRLLRARERLPAIIAKIGAEADLPTLAPVGWRDSYKAKLAGLPARVGPQLVFVERIDQATRRIRLRSGAVLASAPDRITMIRNDRDQRSMEAVKIMVEHALAHGWSTVELTGGNRIWRAKIIRECVRRGLHIANPELAADYTRESQAFELEVLEIAWKRASRESALRATTLLDMILIHPALEENANAISQKLHVALANLKLDRVQDCSETEDPEMLRSFSADPKR